MLFIIVIVAASTSFAHKRNTSRMEGQYGARNYFRFISRNFLEVRPTGRTHHGKEIHSMFIVCKQPYTV